MKILITKMKKFGLLKVELVFGAIWMAAAVIGLPIALMVIDITLLTYPITWGILAMGMLFFGLTGFFCCVRPYLLYRKTPDVLAETDGEFLYIHAKKEGKIPLADLADATAHVNLPYLYQKEFLVEFILHLFCEKYGDIVLEVPSYGTYKLRFVARVEDAANELMSFVSDAVNHD